MHFILVHGIAEATLKSYQGPGLLFESRADAVSGTASLARWQELGQLQQSMEQIRFWGSNLLRSAGAVDLDGVSLFQCLASLRNSQTAQSMGQH